MSNHRYDFRGLGEDESDGAFTVETRPATSTALVATTPSGAPTRQSTDTDWGQIISGAIPVLLSAYQQQQMTKINVARINNGMPPLSTAEYVSVYRPPAAEVQVGATPRTEKLVMFGGLALLVIIGLRAAKII